MYVDEVVTFFDEANLCPAVRYSSSARYYNRPENEKWENLSIIFVIVLPNLEILILIILTNLLSFSNS